MRFVSMWSFARTVPRRDLFKIRKLRTIYQAKHFTMLSYPRLSRLYELTSDVLTSSIDGDIVECGVWYGGSAGVLGRVALRDDLRRQLWLLDSWEGLPAPGEFDINLRGRRGRIGDAAASERKVQELLFGRLDLPKDRVHLLKGWFHDTIPRWKGRMNGIALLHLDCDWYDSVKLCLNELYDLVSPGGYVVIDDYGYWQGCKRAVDEFLSERGTGLRLERIDSTAVCFRNSPAV